MAHGKRSFLVFPKVSFKDLYCFNIFICGLLSIINKVDFASYAEDNAPCYTEWCKRGH